jgi:hypothetical protein
MGHCIVLYFGTGARYGHLTLRRPRHQLVTKEDAKAKGGMARVRVANPIGIGVGYELVDDVEAQL